MKWRKSRLVGHLWNRLGLRLFLRNLSDATIEAVDETNSPASRREAETSVRDKASNEFRGT
jgi:hypothetical protein